jgi:hypothetical protein
MPSNIEDLRKIHAAVNQIDNQRVILSTLAITVFGTAAGWWIAKVFQSPVGPHLPYIFSMVLMGVLLVIFLYSHFFLKRMLRTLTTYLIVKGGSDWERDMQQYRKMFRSDVEWHERAQSMVFLVLGVGGAVFPVALSKPFPATSRTWLVVQICFALIYVGVVVSVGFYNWLDHEQTAQENWTKLLVSDLAKASAAKEAATSSEGRD